MQVEQACRFADTLGSSDEHQRVARDRCEKEGLHLPVSGGCVRDVFGEPAFETSYAGIRLAQLRRLLIHVEGLETLSTPIREHKAERLGQSQ